jgi:hypothetical protein
MANRQTADRRARPTVRRFRPLAVIAIGPALLGACVVVSVKVGFGLGLGLQASGLLGFMLWLGIIGWCLWPGRNLKFRPTNPEVLLVLVLTILTILLWDRAADRSLLWPHAFGVDQAHHGALTTFIFDTGGPAQAVPKLGGMSGYPSGAHGLAAVVGSTFGLNPLSATWLVGMLSGFLELWAIAWVAFTVSRGGHALASLAATGLWLFGWLLGIGMVTESFYFAQSVSVLFGTVGVGLVAVGHKDRRRWYLPAAVFGLAAIWSYPQAAVIIPGAFAAVLFTPVRRWLHTRSRSFTNGLAATGAVLLIVGFVVARSSAAVRVALTGVGEGSLNNISIRTVGGPLAALVLAYGVVQIVRAVRIETPARVILGALVAPVLTAAFFLLLRRGGLNVTSYRINKNGQTAFPILCIAGGFGCSYAILKTLSIPQTEFAQKLGRRIVTIPTIICALSLVLFTARPERRYLTDVPLVDRDAYELARSVSKKLPPDEIGIAGDGLSSYTLWWAGLGRTASYDWKPLIPRMRLFDDWPSGPRTEKYLLVDATVRARYEARPGVSVYETRNGAAVLQRKP